MDKLQAHNEQIVACKRCPRLIEYCRGVAETKRRMYMDWDYWGKPIPGLGDPKARLLVVGLAPAAHGGTYELVDGFPTVICSYHPSRQNTNTGRLTEEMFDHVFSVAKQLIDGEEAEVAN